MSSPLRKLFIALSAMLVLLALCSVAFARKDPPRAQLASDNAISAYMGVSATWHSLINPALPNIQSEMPTNISEYDLTQTPTRLNFVDHALGLMPASTNPDWYVFEPTTETFNLTFNIADTAHRLSKIVVSNIDTGEVVGSLKASADGSSIVGQLSLQWLAPYYRIEGYAVGNAPLFRMAASNGTPDKWVHFTATGQFAPYRPATVGTPRYAGGDNVVGVVGDAYNKNGVNIFTVGGGFFSRGCGARDAKNDVGVTNPLQPPSPLLDYIKKKRIETCDPTRFLSQYPQDLPKLADDINAAGVEDQAKALTDLIASSYSDNTGHWHGKFLGNATAFFAVPYSVANHKNLLTLIKDVFGTLAGNSGSKGDKLSDRLIQDFSTYLTTDLGKTSGLKEGMVKSVGDVKTVVTQEDKKEMPISLPIMTNVTFTMTPNIKPASFDAAGRVDLVSVAPGVVGTPPNSPTFQILNFMPGTTAASATVTVPLAKGWKWKATGNISSPNGFATDMMEYLFSTPGDPTVPMTAHLTICMKLNIVASEPCSLVVKRAGMADITGNTVRVNNQNVLILTTLVPGSYRIMATGIQTVYNPPNPSPTHRTADETRTINTGLEQTENITLN